MLMSWGANFGAIAIGYLLGSLPFAVIVSRLFGLKDPRSFGSGNPGATNVLRTGNKPAAALTLLGDAAKGALAVWLANRYGPAFGVGELGTALTGLAAFLGHLYPLFLRFKGGKGVATFLGVVLAFNPWAFLIAGIVWLMIAGFFRYSSAASIAAAGMAPLAQLIGWGFSPAFGVMLVMTGLLVWRHKTNLSNLLAGRERKIGRKTASAPAPAAANRRKRSH
jgi:glycerol-3-phosphate acyltransferase PlsY